MTTEESSDLHDMAAEVALFRESRSAIEQAKGILMQLLAVDADCAFAVLSRYSQHHNIKVRVLAERLVEAAAQHQTPARGEDGLTALMEQLASTDGLVAPVAQVRSMMEALLGGRPCGPAAHRDD